MDPLAGWTIAVTCDRRADEQAELLQRRGADVVLVPLVASQPVAEDEVRAATQRVLSGPLDVLVATTGVGMRSWLAMAWAWGLGDDLIERLRAVEVRSRGAKTLGSLVSED